MTGQMREKGFEEVRGEDQKKMGPGEYVMHYGNRAERRRLLKFAGHGLIKKYGSVYRHFKLNANAT